jgi:hypothetical protein
MTITINGTTGIAGVDGSAGTPAVQGADTNTGVFFPAADTIAFAEGGTEVMRIDSSGNLAIGATSASFGAGSGVELVRSGTATFRATSGSQGVEYRNNAGTAEIDTRGAFPIVLLTNQSERARITSGGLFKVGTASIAGNRLVQIAGSSATGYGMEFNYDQSADYTAVQFYRNSTVTVSGSITVAASSVAYLTSSDYRLKENVAPMTGALSKVAQLKPVTYTWKIDGSSGQGFVAHELQEVVPDCVVGEKDAVDANGNPQYQGVDTSFLVATLTAAIQELKAELDSAKARLAALEAK